MNKFLIALLLVLGFAACSSSDDEDLDTEATFLSAGTTAPDFTVETDDDYNGRTLSSFRGQYVLIEFWRSSCPDCRKVTNSVKGIFERYTDSGLVMIGISSDENKDEWQSYIDLYGLNWVQHYEGKDGGSSLIRSKYSVSWVPTFYLIDPEGKVVYATCYVERMESRLASVYNGIGEN